MARVTEAELRAIVTTAIADLTSFITTANIYVTEELAGHPCMSDDRLKQIELYLAAHLVAVSDDQDGGRVTEEKIGDASKKYAVQSINDGGWDSTKYGQMAKMLDCSGVIASSGRRRAIGTVV